jgi:F0F1-type ATP synthase assembly protein I
VKVKNPAVVLRPKRDIALMGSDDSMTKGIEIAGTVLVLFVMGFFLDRWLGTAPIFMIVLTIIAMVVQFIKMYYVYSAQMETKERQRAAMPTAHQQEASAT